MHVVASRPCFGTQSFLGPSGIDASGRDVGHAALHLRLPVSNLALPFIIFTKNMMSPMSDHMDSLAAFSMHPVNVKPRPRLLASHYECSSDEIA